MKRKHLSQEQIIAILKERETARAPGADGFALALNIHRAPKGKTNRQSELRVG